MLLTIATTHEPATDLGFLLRKHPGRAQAFDLPVGRAHVFYPEARPERCTAALLLEVDPVALTRSARGRPGGWALGQYVNDRSYAASSLLAVAVGRVLRSALKGDCPERPELAGRALPLEVTVPAVPCRGGPELAQRLFAPLGWAVEATPVALDPEMPEWGEARYVTLRLVGELVLAEALRHLYVLLPVLDDAKHYWVADDEVDKLVRAGEGWLAGHPEQELVARRYLRHRKELTREALARLAAVDDVPEAAIDDALAGAVVDEADEPADVAVPLAVQRRGAVLAVLRAAGAGRVLDLGCGGGALLADLLRDPAFTELVGVDVSLGALQVASRRLRLDRLPERQQRRIRLLQGSLVYRDRRLEGYDAAVLMEVVEHVDPSRLGALERTVFGHARPGTVVVTTPNVEYNVRWATLPAGAPRHRDHRFEWDRAELAAWAGRVAARWGYRPRLLGVGDEDPEVGPPTQMAVFSR